METIEQRLEILRSKWKAATPVERLAIKEEADWLKRGLAWRKVTVEEELEKNARDILMVK